jgi:hypothetical protein
MTEEQREASSRTVPFSDQGAELWMLAEPVARNDGFRSLNFLGPLLVLGKFRDQLPDHEDIIDCSCTNGQHRKGLSPRPNQKAPATTG